MKNKYYLPRADKAYLTPNEKWYRLQGILLGMIIGVFISLLVVIIAL
jgi:hypothetical protein